VLVVAAGGAYIYAKKDINARRKEQLERGERPVEKKEWYDIIKEEEEKSKGPPKGSDPESDSPGSVNQGSDPDISGSTQASILNRSNFPLSNSNSFPLSSISPSLSPFSSYPPLRLRYSETRCGNESRSGFGSAGSRLWWPQGFRGYNSGGGSQLGSIRGTLR